MKLTIATLFFAGMFLYPFTLSYGHEYYKYDNGKITKVGSKEETQELKSDIDQRIQHHQEQIDWHQSEINRLLLEKASIETKENLINVEAVL